MNEVVADKLGAYTPSEPDPLQRRMVRILKGTASFNDRYVPNHEELAALIAHLRNMGCAIAFTTGVWDLFHIGHADYIAVGKDKARELYPQAEHVIMVVGLDSDKLTAKRKGPDRPVVPEDERARVLGHLRTVDIITPQYESNQLYRLVKHDVRITSTSTTDLPGLDEMRRHCGHLVNLPPQAETSTTARLRRLAMDGGREVLKKIQPQLADVLKRTDQEVHEIVQNAFTEV